LNKERVRIAFNSAALSITLLYLIGIFAAIAAGVFFNHRIDDDYLFAFFIEYMSWGGVAVMGSVLTLMLIKLAIVKE